MIGETIRRWPRWLAYGMAPMMVGGALALGVGFSGRWPGPAPAMGQENRGSNTPSQAAPTPAPDPGAEPPASPTAPAVDPRVERALGTRVRLKAGKASLWTELRRLGVGLTWPEGGEPEWTLDDRWFNRGLSRLARRAERMPRNARLIHTQGSFKAIPGRSGQRLDRAEARRQLLAGLAERGFRESLNAAPPAKPNSITLSVPLREAAPTVTAAHLGPINTPLATYSTTLGGSSRNRRHNIRIACEAIDGTVLLPGDVFSYNDTVGPRSERAGYRTAPVIIRGELVPGTGGGICQVSSTLYNAALLADLKIVRRRHHQFPVAYVPPGRDATVAYGSLDLRFANSLPKPVMLDVKSTGSRVIVRLFGAPECKREVRLINSRVSWTRPRVPVSGGPARPGKRVTVSRVVRLANGSERREIISRDVYAPAPAPARRSARRRRGTGGTRFHGHRSRRIRSRSPRSGAAPQRPVAAAPRATSPAAAPANLYSSET